MPPEAPPGWFRAVVWDSLLAGMCPLLPVPFVDDVALGRVRRRMVFRIAGSADLALTRTEAKRLAGPRRSWGCGRLAAKAILYPVKKVFRKVIYVFAIKEAIDTLSETFHRGYLLHAIAARGMLGPGRPDPERLEAVAAAVDETVDALDTRPLEGVVSEVLRSSRRSVAATVAWLVTRVKGRGGVESAEAEFDRERLSESAPETRALFDRLLAAIWDEGTIRRRLDEELDRHLV